MENTAQNIDNQQLVTPFKGQIFTDDNNDQWQIDEIVFISHNDKYTSDLLSDLFNNYEDPCTDMPLSESFDRNDISNFIGHTVIAAHDTEIPEIKIALLWEDVVSPETEDEDEDWDTGDFEVYKYKI